MVVVSSCPHDPVEGCAEEVLTGVVLLVAELLSTCFLLNGTSCSPQEKAISPIIAR
jgi:hypothetical protein